MKTGIQVTIDRRQLLLFAAYSVGMIALTALALAIVLSRHAINFIRTQYGLSPVVWQGIADGATEATQATIDYSALTIRELKAIARDRKIAGYSRMSKAALIAAIQ